MRSFFMHGCGVCDGMWALNEMDAMMSYTCRMSVVDHVRCE